MSDDTTLATPGQALAATVIALLDAGMAKDRASRAAIGVNRSQLEGEAIGLDAAAALVRERLTPAWHDLAAERDAAREMLRREDGDFDARLAVLDSVIAERDRYRTALEHARHVLEEHDEPDDDARSRALAIIVAALEAAP